MKYFANFPSLMYTFDETFNEFSRVTNLFARVKMLDSVITAAATYYTYALKETDTLEIVAHKYYNDPNRHWIIYLTNKILDPYFGMPLDTLEFNNALTDKYGSVANAESFLHHIELRVTKTVVDINGQQTVSEDISLFPNNIISINQYTSLPNIENPVIVFGNTSVIFDDGTVVDTETSLVAVNAYDYENEVNEDKRVIKLIKRDYVEQVETELKNLLTSQ